MSSYVYESSVPSLCEVFAPYFKVGSAINTWNLADEKRIDFLTLNRQFNIFTLENESKPVEIHPHENEWRFDKFDKFVEFGEKHGKTLRGHTLIWHGQCPDWFFKKTDGDFSPENTVSSEVLLARVRSHVSTAVSRYRGKIAVWDVVNEVLSDAGGMRKSLWHMISGEEYIKEAFRAAREADPDARLIINDYNLESSTAKAETMYEFVKSMLLEGIPVDGVGLQMHLGLNTDMELLKKNVLLISSLRDIKPDFKLEVTEADITMYPYEWQESEGEVVLTDELENALAAKYTELFRFYLELARENILDSVVFWGLHDGVSWLNGFPKKHINYPLLISRDFTPKPAFASVCALVKYLPNR